MDELLTYVRLYYDAEEAALHLEEIREVQRKDVAKAYCLTRNPILISEIVYLPVNVVVRRLEELGYGSEVEGGEEEAGEVRCG